ncbi:hypothetical protein HGRIS_014171 [Hohenbuehelia grisea]|uniref:Aminoglycoside phosphotransferase domain-containing protein n=1 Tax=Hohenbuehelia grisea TaxID=104357 RepID=A0ABR3JTJ4_9AGAR
MPLSAHDAQRLLAHHFPETAHAVITSFTELDDQESFSYTPRIKTYAVTIQPSIPPDPTSPPTPLAYTSFHISLAFTPDPDAPPPVYQKHGNDLAAIDDLLKRIRASSSIPVPPSSTLDTSHTLIPQEYLICPIPDPPRGSTRMSLAAARREGKLGVRGGKRVALEVGMYLAQLHRIQNDWFGAPVPADPSDASYSWQESFVALVEGAMEDLEARMGAATLPFEVLRKYLGRAIGFFLFDDVEAPSAVGFAWEEEDVLVSVGGGEGEEVEVKICTVLPSALNWAVWGDPLLETLFMPPGPEPAILEGYSEAGGAPLIVFPRQKTKRHWYTVFLALIVLERLGDEDGESEVTRARREWALDMVHTCIRELETSPCY